MLISIAFLDVYLCLCSLVLSPPRSAELDSKLGALGARHVLHSCSIIAAELL